MKNLTCIQKLLTELSLDSNFNTGVSTHSYVHARLGQGGLGMGNVVFIL